MYRCFTLFDITSNGITDYKKNQQRNWYTILQALTMMSFVTIHSQPKQVYRNTENLELGENYDGYHEIWIFDFELDGEHTIDSIYEHLDFIPMISGLTETAIFEKNCIICNGQNKNISVLLI